MNPYEVLGVSEDADEETIKKAYKELVKKYHPDKYVNNPLADLATEKMKEINQAYDMIKNKNRTGSSSGGYSQSGSYGGGYSRQGGYSYQNARPTFALVRTLINMQRIAEANAMLQQLPKTAEWYYLNGLLSIRRGWYTQGIKDLEQAVRMDPDNAEYSNTLNSIKNRSASYTNSSSPYNTGGTDCCGYMPCWCIPCMCPGPCCC